MLALGIDLGSVYGKLVLLHEEKRILKRFLIKRGKEFKEEFLKLLLSIGDEKEEFILGISGSGISDDDSSFKFTNHILSIAEGAKFLNPEVRSIIEKDEGRFFFGDICERYTSSKEKDSKIPNIAREYIEECEKFFNRFPDRKNIGIPRGSAIYSYLPFFATFFSELGFNPILSPFSSEEILSLGIKVLPSSFCLPVKLAVGHALKILEDSEFLFFPAIYKFHGLNDKNSFSCPYTQTLPFLAELKGKILNPVISMKMEEFVECFLEFKELLDLSEKEIESAFKRGMEAQIEFERSMRERAKDLIKNEDKLFLILGRPYNIYDSFLNLNLFEHLRKLGVLGIPAYLISAPYGEAEIPWYYPSLNYIYSLSLKNRDRVIPLILSNFGCAPDAFTFRHIENILKDEPYLMLEFDEHRAETGMITRIEAFLDRIGSSYRKEKKKEVIKNKIIAPEKKEKILIPYFADAVYAYSGLWKLKGYDVEILPLPDEKTKILGEAHSYGKECHAFPMLLGDLIKAIIEKKEGSFTFPGTTSPCMLHQFPSTMRALLDDLGEDNVKVYAPNGEAFFKLFGFDGCVSYYRALFAIDFLIKALCRVRPYEKEKGLSDKIHKENLLNIEKSILKGNIYDALEEGLKRLSKIPLKNLERFPLVGVAGDIYTRINPSVNQNLFSWLEERGIEVIPAPFQIDVLDFDISHDFYTNLKKIKPFPLLYFAYLYVRREVELWLLKRRLKSYFQIPEEPSYKDVIKIAKEYMGNIHNKVLLLNVAKMIDFARKGADGIINAICFNCMIGNSSSAIAGKTRNDYGNIPIITAVYSGSENPALKISMETFVEQVKRFRERKSLLIKAR